MKVNPGSNSDGTSRLNTLRELAQLTDWPHDALRHSFGSYAYDLTDNAPLVCARMPAPP